MYERVIRHQEQGRGRDLSLFPHVALVIMIAAAIIAPMCYMGRMMYRYLCFKQDLAQSTTYAERLGVLSKEQGSRFFTLVVDAGMGKPQADVPNERPARFEFGDGSAIELWQVAIDGHEDRPGTLIRYTRADGDVFAYDTDGIDYQIAVDALC